MAASQSDPQVDLPPDLWQPLLCRRGRTPKARQGRQITPPTPTISTSLAGTRSYPIELRRIPQPISRHYALKERIPAS